MVLPTADTGEFLGTVQPFLGQRTGGNLLPKLPPAPDRECQRPDAHHKASKQHIVEVVLGVVCYKAEECRTCTSQVDGQVYNRGDQPDQPRVTTSRTDERNAPP